jgi:hypothetical protein
LGNHFFFLFKKILDTNHLKLCEFIEGDLTLCLSP